MMNEFRLSRRSDIPRLRRLWKDAFGDKDSYLDIFFAAAYAPERCMVLTREQEILGGAYWLDCELDGKKLAYLYAVAIDPGAQNRGLGTRLMERLHGHLTREGYAAALLVPGSDGLREYYRRFGYRTASHHREFIAQAGTPVPMTKIDAQRYGQLRRRYLPKNGVVQEAENLALLNALADFYEGPGFVAALSRRSCLELLGNANQAPGITAALNLPQCPFRTPGSTQPYAMAKPLTGAALPEELYFGFGFD